MYLCPAAYVWIQIACRKESIDNCPHQVLLHALERVYISPAHSNTRNKIPTHSCNSHALLVSRHQAVRRSKLGVRTSERLSTSTNRNKVLAILETLTLDQISKEIHQITAETGNIGTIRSKRVNLIHTIASIPQLPAVRDGTSTTEGG
jgi:hypothetical protein